jgi:hypothetical protein
MQSRAGINHVHFMLGVAWWGTILAAFRYQVVCRGRKGGRRKIKLSEDPLGRLSEWRTGLGVSNAENPGSWHCDNRNVDDADALPSRPRHMHCSHPFHFFNCSQFSARSPILSTHYRITPLSLSIFRSFLNSANRTSAFLMGTISSVRRSSTP